MKLSSLEFAQTLGALPMPVLFADTCALFDIMRLPIRKSATTVRKELDAIQAIVNAADNSSPAIRILLPEQVNREWGENVVAVEADVDRVISTWANQTAQFDSALSHLGGPSVPPNLGTTFRKVIVDLKGLAAAVFARAILIDDEDACMAKAMQRVLRGSAPAQKGEQGKDCAIIEHVLTATRIIRAGSSCGCVFLSSNTRDYRQAMPSTQLRPPLDAEFAATNLTFCTDWSWARTELGV